MKKAIAIILLAASPALGSEVISGIKKFLPTPTEAGFLVNAINVYMQVSQFVRSTNQLVRSVKQTKESWDALTREMEEVFTELGRIREIDPYNMSTWDDPLRYAQSALTAELWDVEYYFNMFDRCVVWAPLDYIREINSLDDYNYMVNKAGELIREKYYHKESTLDNEIFQYYQSSLFYVSRELARCEEWSWYGYDCPEETVEELKAQQEYLEGILKAAFLSEDKNDSLVIQAEEIMKINLTEIQVMKDRLARIKQHATKLVEQYYNLTGNNVGFREMLNQIEATVTGSREEYDETDPDKVPTPEIPQDEGEIERPMDRDVNQQDILALQNAIEFCMLQQEAILRDIEIMKINTFAVITAFEAQRKWEPLETAIINAVYATRLSYDTD